MKTLGWMVLLCFFSLVWAAEYEGFTEPDREIEVAAQELGVLEQVAVQEGETVAQGQLLARLISRDLEASLEIAKARAKATGRLRAARAERKLRRIHLDKLIPLQKKGVAHPQEVNQTRMELEVASANVQAANEDLAIAKLDIRRIEAQIENRTLRSPIDGTVTAILRDPAELVGGSQSHVMTVAALHPLRINLHIPTAQAVALKLDQNVEVEFPGFPEPRATGTIAFVSPITDAGSDTVKVRVIVANPEGKLRGGIRCLVRVADDGS